MFANGAQGLGCEPPQPYGVYAWQAYVSPGHGPWSMHRVP